jgi:L-fuculose-phosphate aldolase
MTEREARERICEVSKDLWDRGLIGAAEGNVTCRLDDGRVLATPTGAIKGKLSAQDIACVSLDGECLGPECPSSEIKMHLSIYHHTPARAVVHAHPPAATAFALAGKTIPSRTLPEADMVLGEVALAPFESPGTADMGEALVPFLPRSAVILLGSHGAVAIAKSLTEAYIRMETLERVARTFLLADRLGGAQKLPEKGVRWLSDF